MTSKDKNRYALKIVDLDNQTNEKTKNALVKEIVFLEKLKQCNYVIKAYDYEIRESEAEHKMFVLMEKGDKERAHKSFTKRSTFHPSTSKLSLNCINFNPREV